MTIQLLFRELQTMTTNEINTSVFQDSGILNKYQKLDFGFFPLGPGIHSEQFNIASFVIPQNGTMILGNDFGTNEYLLKKCPYNREQKSNPTIHNLTTKLNLDLGTTFFTNFYLGVRVAGTNLKRVTPLQDCYKKMCYDFFLTQLKAVTKDNYLFGP